MVCWNRWYVPKYTRVLSSGFEVGAILLLDVNGPAASFGNADCCLMNEVAKHREGIRARLTAFLQVKAYMAMGLECSLILQSSSKGKAVLD
jgi:hypothetical protein